MLRLSLRLWLFFQFQVNRQGKVKDNVEMWLKLDLMVKANVKVHVR